MDLNFYERRNRMEKGAVKRFLNISGCHVSIEGTREAVDRGEILIKHIGLNGNEEEDRTKLKRLVRQYQKTSLDFPVICYSR